MRPDALPVIPRPVPDAAWLASHTEQIIDPTQPIIDPHHHLWDRDGGYLLSEMLDDTATGHRIDATVFVECGQAYRTEGPEQLRPVGETEFAAAIYDAAAASRSATRLCAGIVGHADLELGDGVAEVLRAHLEAGRGRFRGVRYMAARSDAFDSSTLGRPPEGLLARPGFRRGLVHVQRLGLVFDAWVYHPQLSEVIALARAMPELTIVLDHLGGPLGVGPYRARAREIFRQWRESMKELSGCSNVWLKLGGLGIAVCGFAFDRRPVAPSSKELAEAWAPYIHAAIELFGPCRCMFESNFPVDKGMCSYPVLWNTFKRIAQGASADEKSCLFSTTAGAVYGLKGVECNRGEQHGRQVV